ncbi:MAG: hypothetical protein KDA61_13415, partial [Planctomycetales bacterium]|nr:hypothetical protein [Planctomycetales bacterium]
HPREYDESKQTDSRAAILTTRLDARSLKNALFCIARASESRKNRQRRAAEKSEKNLRATRILPAVGTRRRRRGTTRPM